MVVWLDAMWPVDMRTARLASTARSKMPTKPLKNDFFESQAQNGQLSKIDLRAACSEEGGLVAFKQVWRDHFGQAETVDLPMLELFASCKGKFPAKSRARCHWGKPCGTGPRCLRFL